MARDSEFLALGDLALRAVIGVVGEHVDARQHPAFRRPADGCPRVDVVDPLVGELVLLSDISIGVGVVIAFDVAVVLSRQRILNPVHRAKPWIGERHHVVDDLGEIGIRNVERLLRDLLPIKIASHGRMKRGV